MTHPEDVTAVVPSSVKEILMNRAILRFSILMLFCCSAANAQQQAPEMSALASANATLSVHGMSTVLNGDANATAQDQPAPVPSEAGAGGSYVQLADEGRIDWQDGLVTAKGVGLPPAFAATPAQARAMAVRAAEVTARKNLLETLQGVQIDAATNIENRMVRSDAVRTQVSGVLQNSRVLETNERADGSVEVVVGVSLRGGIGAIMLPRTMPVRTAASAPKASETCPTGLLIDAKGLGARPAMTPRLLDENGREVYGVSVVERQYAVEQGMAGYAKDRGQALQNARIKGRPHTVKAIRAEGPNRTDLVISAADADELRRLAAQGDFLEQCRVMILLD